MGWSIWWQNSTWDGTTIVINKLWVRLLDSLLVSAIYSSFATLYTLIYITAVHNSLSSTCFLKNFTRANTPSSSSYSRFLSFSIFYDLTLRSCFMANELNLPPLRPGNKDRTGRFMLAGSAYLPGTTASCLQWTYTCYQTLFGCFWQSLWDSRPIWHIICTHYLSSEPSFTFTHHLFGFDLKSSNFQTLLTFVEGHSLNYCDANDDLVLSRSSQFSFFWCHNWPDGFLRCAVVSSPHFNINKAGLLLHTTCMLFKSSGYCCMLDLNRSMKSLRIEDCFTYLQLLLWLLPRRHSYGRKLFRY